ncbi:MAG: ABC transporter ATP-binding protein [Desulfobacteraceae bacterium]|nr:MAG: ABC transporter ATP-binding protein [Desulfobacteraceae bacterium]
MLRLESLSCGYGPVRAVHDLSFEVEKGALFALLGPNGAGKTSTIMAIMGHVDVQAGRIFFESEEMTGRPAMDRVKEGIAVVPEGRLLFTDLSVDENLIVGGYALPRSEYAENRERVFSLFPRLAERHKQIAGSLSGGEQQMLAIGRALMSKPKFLLVDELSLGLMPKMVDLCFEALLTLKRNGLTILLVEQNTARALDIADEVCILASGRLVYRGSSGEAKEKQGLFETYLGVVCEASASSS